MSLELAKALTNLYTIREREKLQGQRTEIPDWTFCDRHNQPLTKDGLRVIFNRALKRSGYSGHTTYDLRHTFATQLLANGAPLPYVSAQLGHKGPATTFKYYSRWIPTGDRRFVDGLDRDFGTNSGTNAENPLRSLDISLTSR
jgi:site-specific recombinase XerD